MYFGVMTILGQVRYVSEQSALRGGRRGGVGRVARCPGLAGGALLCEGRVDVGLHLGGHLLNVLGGSVLLRR